MCQNTMLLIAATSLLSSSDANLPWRPLCKDSYTVAWWPVPPYIYEENSTLTGIFSVIMDSMIHDCCNAPVNLSYSIKVANKVEAVDQVSNGTADFVLPLIVKNGKTNFLGFPYVTIVESPGIAFYSSSPLNSGEALIRILVKATPILVLMTVTVMIAGTSYWLIEKRQDSSIIPGILDGMWWAFVSMTTVGYGDISPTSKKGRMVAILWILFGLVACSLFVAVVSSVLTMTCLSQKSTIRDSEIAVISGSQEHALAIRKSAKAVPFSKIEDIARSLEKGTSAGALLDSYVAGFYQQRFKKFRLNILQEDLFNYGVVLMPSVMKYEQCFKNYLASRQDFFFSVVSQQMIPLKKTKNESTAEEMSMTLLHVDAIPTHLAILLLAAVVFVIFAICFAKQRFRFSWRNCKAANNKESYDICVEENNLHTVQESHKRQLLECLCRMKAEAEALREACNEATGNCENEATGNCENEARYILNENGVLFESYS